MATSSLRYARRTAIYTSIGIVAVSVAALFLAEAYIPSGAVQDTVLGVVNAVLALGLVGLAYEVFLRDVVFKETVETIGLSKDVSESSLSAIDAGLAFDWDLLLEETNEIAVLVVNPMGWIERDWESLISAARARPLTIDIYVLKPDGQFTTAVADRLGYDEDLLVKTLTQLREYLETSWRSAKAAEGGPVKGCQFNLRSYDFIPGYEIAVTQTRVSVLIPEINQQHLGGKKLRMSFDKRRSSYPETWFRSHVATLRSIPADYADEVD